MGQPTAIGARDGILTFIKAEHEKNKPQLKADAISFADANASKMQIQKCVLGIEQLYEGLKTQVQQRIQAQTVRVHESLNKTIEAREREHNDEKISEARDEKRICEDEKRRLPRITYDWSSYSWKPWVEFGLLSAEVFINTYALSMPGSTLITSILPAVAVAIALCVLSIYFGRTYMELEGSERKRFVRKSALLMTVAFLMLATLRCLATMAGGQWHFSLTIVLGSIAYAGVNWLVFAGAVVFGTTLPSSEDRMSKMEHDRLEQRIEKSRATIESYENMNRTLDLRADDTQRNHIDLIGDEIYFSALIKSYCNEALMIFFRELTIRNPKLDYLTGINETSFTNNKNSLL